MPRTFKMTWQPGDEHRAGRWRKKYRRRSYYFSGGRGKSDRDAYEAALAAWEALKVKIDRESPRPHQLAYDQAIDQWEQVLAWCNRHGDRETAAIAYQKVELLRGRLAVPTLEPLSRSEIFDGLFDLPKINLGKLLTDSPDASELEIERPPQPDPTARARYAEELDGSPTRIAREIWQDRLEMQRLKAASRDESLQGHVEKYVAHKQSQSKVGDLSAGRVYSLNLHLTCFQDWLGKDTAVREIDGDVLLRFRAHLMEKVTSGEWGKTTAKHYLDAVKSFVRWLWASNAIPSLPRILDARSPDLKITRVLQEPVVFTLAEVKELLAAATGRTRLYILLMLNCGMTQKDISDLRVSEVDWEKGRIIRRRSKTATCRNVPVVDYKLWPETLRLLKQERAADSQDRVLLNHNGGFLWFAECGDNGKLRKNDNIKNAFERLRAAKDIKKSLKSFKKTSASLLRGNPRFESVRDLFLDHAPTTIGDRHYAKAPTKLLDQAIDWLAKQYGL